MSQIFAALLPGLFVLFLTQANAQELKLAQLPQSSTQSQQVPSAISTNCLGNCANQQTICQNVCNGGGMAQTTCLRNCVAQQQVCQVICSGIR